MPKTNAFSAGGMNRKAPIRRETHDKPFSKDEIKALDCGMADMGLRKPNLKRIKSKPMAWHGRFLKELERHGSLKLACHHSGANYQTVKSTLSKNPTLRAKADLLMAQAEKRKILRAIRGKQEAPALGPRRLKYLKLAGFGTTL